MPNLQKTLLDKIFRPNRFKRIFAVREQIQRIEKMYSESYMRIGVLSPECIMRYNQIRKEIDEQAIYDRSGEMEVLFQLVQYRDILLDVAKDTNLDIDDIIYEIRMEKLRNLNIS